MLRIRLFGSLSVASGDGGEGVAIAGRCANLLAYLALGHGRYFSRSELLANLWPERTASSTPGSFNTALWRLRRMVERPPLKQGDLIVSDRRGAIGLNGPAGVWLDVEEFERLISPGLAGAPERLSDADIDGLRRGVAMYKSDILLDVTDDWALREREKHRRSYLNALGRLMQLATIRRDYEEAIARAQAILDSDALREDVHRDLMQLYVMSGQRAQALQQFECCRDLLRRELAIQPMRETMEVYRRIADSAVGMPARERAWTMPESGPYSPATGQSRDGDPADPCILIELARRQLSEADAQLQLSLTFLRR
ncbi:AfsR/SARP family transcriptional regulator [Marilutibacter chinensis]|uniref:Winged helix-turn-helix domain-containing protein n=1 Tax=Marilutibacter chinensis TaxID=2912247 RepID=A0ABS9HPL4_9GAMM|nr:BTAD domain-containing putative transcriptional regulator [Lysobacter chinensis]MCF7220881.1 winged helix-turn-helix domain-containing protein [Lysobacter chinensis]